MCTYDFRVVLLLHRLADQLILPFLRLVAGLRVDTGDDEGHVGGWSGLVHVADELHEIELGEKAMVEGKSVFGWRARVCVVGAMT